MANHSRILIAVLVTVLSLVTRPSFAGREMNGREMNGREMNGREMNGREMNSASLNGVFLDGLWLGDLTLEGSVLSVVEDGQVILSGSDLVGLDLTGVLDDDSEIALTIDSFDQPNGSDVAYHPKEAFFARFVTEHRKIADDAAGRATLAEEAASHFQRMCSRCPEDLKRLTDRVRALV